MGRGMDQMNEVEQLHERTNRLREVAVKRLLAEQTVDGHWVGELSQSALSTATAITALYLFGRNGGNFEASDRALVAEGASWLVEHQNVDGGWGDTVISHSNISTTTLVWAALGLISSQTAGSLAAIEKCEGWLEGKTGSLEPKALRGAIEQRYGADRTFSIPILTMCALCGRLGPDRSAWSQITPLPFELAALPQAWFGLLRLPVVSYALPALIAIGQVRHHFRPTRNPVTRLIRNATRKLTLDKLIRLQPDNGGFLEATPLTSFVTMSLAAMGEVRHPATMKGVQFIRDSAQPDGSWAIDTNLATWATTLSVNALNGNTATANRSLPEKSAAKVREWLLSQQYRDIHPYTLAAPGGWAWTNLPGGVPDADDTAGALLALDALKKNGPRETGAAQAGIRWLLDLQNRDGGIPTFCRGWGTLPFDRSSPDITAHSIRAWTVWRKRCDPALQQRITTGLAKSLHYLERVQREDGSWLPLWFGHQDNPDDVNPVYGTTRVLHALALVDSNARESCPKMIRRGCRWLISCQKKDGGWSGGEFGESSLEETALTIEALSASFLRLDPEMQATAMRSLAKGIGYLEGRLSAPGFNWPPAPIGFYFARLWYYERLYPIIFVTGALTHLTSCLESRTTALATNVIG